MQRALEQAHAASTVAEVPVGAVLVWRGALVAEAHNLTRTVSDPTAHAEIVVLRRAAARLGSARLEESTLYVTLEPCAMCAMALLHARIKRVVFAAPDPKTGAAGSVIDLFGSRALNHHTEIAGGVQAEPAGALLREFFVQRRAELRAERDAAAGAPDAAAPQDVPPIPTGEVIESQPPPDEPR